MAQKRFRREQIPMVERQARAEVAKAWRESRGAQRFVQRYYPHKFERIRDCRSTWRWQESVAEPGLVKPIAQGCDQDPWCIVCAQRKTLLRTMKHLDKFHRTTPKGKQPRFFHMVQTAPLTRDGLGWGKQASEDMTTFFKVVWEALQDEFGDGIGAVMSYQDFGEQGFAKRHPHLDLTLNGWKLQDGEPVKLPQMDLAGQGRARWDARVQGKATKYLAIDARRGNFNASGPFVGHTEYFKILRYQVRELVDLRKLDYPRGSEYVWWKDYKNNRRTRMEVSDFQGAMGEYEYRLGRWQHGVGVKNLHRLFGTMSKRTLNQTMAKIGGEPRPHKHRCPCSECEDWIDVELTPEEEAKLRPWRLNPVPV